MLKMVRHIERNPGPTHNQRRGRAGARDRAIRRNGDPRRAEPWLPQLPEFRRTLAVQLGSGSPAAHMQRTLGEVGKNAGRAIERRAGSASKGTRPLQSPISPDRLIAAVSVLNGAERIIVFGIGTSSLPAQYVSMLLTCIGQQARSLDATEIALANQLLDLRASDASLLLAYGRARGNCHGPQRASGGGNGTASGVGATGTS
jgi:hypothetical protein